MFSSVLSFEVVARRKFKTPFGSHGISVDAQSAFMCYLSAVMHLVRGFLLFRYIKDVYKPYFVQWVSGGSGLRT